MNSEWGGLTCATSVGRQWLYSWRLVAMRCCTAVSSCWARSGLTVVGLAAAAGATAAMAAARRRSFWRVSTSTSCCSFCAAIRLFSGEKYLEKRSRREDLKQTAAGLDAGRRERSAHPGVLEHLRAGVAVVRELLVLRRVEPEPGHQRREEHHWHGLVRDRRQRREGQRSRSRRLIGRWARGGRASHYLPVERDRARGLAALVGLADVLQPAVQHFAERRGAGGAARAADVLEAPAVPDCTRVSFAAWWKPKESGWAGGTLSHLGGSPRSAKPRRGGGRSCRVKTQLGSDSAAAARRGSMLQRARRSRGPTTRRT